MGETHHTAPSLWLFRPEQPNGVSPFLSSVGCACNVTLLYISIVACLSRFLWLQQLRMGKTRHVITPQVSKWSFISSFFRLISATRSSPRRCPGISWTVVVTLLKLSVSGSCEYGNEPPPQYPRNLFTPCMPISFSRRPFLQWINLIKFWKVLLTKQTEKSCM
jgi:hypothetical protein